nr:hypothetical protein, putative lipoprotein attachment site [uncultured bacterium]
MQRFINACGILAMGLALASCDKPPSHSVEYYKKNDAERAAMLAQCKANPDLSTKTTNCTSAADAEALSGSFTPSKPRAW